MRVSFSTKGYIFDPVRKVVSANINNLSFLFPKKEADLDNNPDLLGVAFNGFVANRFNKNGSAMTLEMAKKVARKFYHKQINWEHNRADVVGHILKHGYTTFSDNSPIDDPEDDGTPINVAFGGVLYKISHADISRDYAYELSASWEVSYNERSLYIGGPNLSEATKVEKWQEEEYSQYLLVEGGKGMTPNGKPVNFVIEGEPQPLAMGITLTPAADVSGLCVDKKDNFSEIAEKIYSALENYKKIV